MRQARAAEVVVQLVKRAAATAARAVTRTISLVHPRRLRGRVGEALPLLVLDPKVEGAAKVANSSRLCSM
ncbi:hypothetical protein CS343_06190 [Bordetella bronchiseptica]|nr:hypothetical protein CS343_06190 [Bordetella bronchiseptica]